MRKCELYKEQIITEWVSASTKIHLTVDLWTSGNHKSIIGVIGHYINAVGNLKHNVLGVRELEDSHEGRNQSKIVIEVLKDFGIERNIGFFVGDNDGKNVTLVQALSECKS